MEFLRDAYRAFQEKRKDPRNIEIRNSSEDLHRKFEELCEPALGHVYANLSRFQADQILPQGEESDGMRVHIILFGPRVYTCSLGPENSGLMFILDDDNARLSRYVPAEHTGFYDNFKVTDLVRQDADSKDIKLQGLHFGHRMVDVLMDVKHISPEAFSYI